MVYGARGQWRRYTWGTGARAPWSLRMHANVADLTPDSFHFWMTLSQGTSEPVRHAPVHPLEQTSGDATARDTSDLISMVSFTFSMRRHLIRLASAPFTSFRLAQFDWVPFADLVCNAWQQNRKQNLQRVLENSGPVLTRLWAKVHEILEQCRRPLLLPNAFARLSTSCFV